VAVAWICDHCDVVVDLVGLFTSWPAAIYARQLELDDRAARYFSDSSRQRHQPVSISTDCRRTVTAEFRRHGTK
jgi:hypothetical protein